MGKRSLAVTLLLLAMPVCAQVTTIYNNLAPLPNLYNKTSGLTLEHTSNSSLEWAMPFTPHADYLIIEVQIAISWVSGFNGATVSICEDKNGLPGMSLRDYNVQDLPTFGQSSRNIKILKYSKGVKVYGKKQYWIAAKSVNLSSDKWNLTFNPMNGPIAKNQNNGGWTVANGPLGALAIFGVR